MIVLKVITKEDIFGDNLPAGDLYFSTESYFDTFNRGSLFMKNCKCKLIPYKKKVSIDKCGLVWDYDIIVDNIGGNISPIYVIGKIFSWK